MLAPNLDNQGKSLPSVVKMTALEDDAEDADPIDLSPYKVKTKEPPSTADNDSSKWAMRDLNPRHPRCKRANALPEDVAGKDLTSTLSAACTNACTRLQETVQDNPLDVLADELRQTLTTDEIQHLAELLSDSSNSSADQPKNWQNESETE